MQSAPKADISAREEPQDPLRGFASILALPSIRARLEKSSREGAWTSDETLSLLSLDPLTLVRLLRLVHAPIGQHDSEILSVPELAKALGNHNLRRALRTPSQAVPDAPDLRKLWLHSVATAHAARDLAMDRGTIDPEQAWLLGLLHDLPLWTQCLGHLRESDDPTIDYHEWANDWRLPPTLSLMIDARINHDESSSSPAASIISTAEKLAELAGFRHPQDKNLLSEQTPAYDMEDRDMTRSRSLRQKVLKNLTRFGLETMLVEGTLTVETPAPIAAPPATAHLADMALNLSSSNEATSYRSITTIAMSAALRYLGFERVHHLRWTRPQPWCHIRTKADLSPRRLSMMQMGLTKQEHSAFEEARRTRMPAIINRKSGGLLQGLGTDQALLVPVNPDFGVPTFLILDRAYSASPIVMDHDAVGAQTLASITTLLIENLLLRQRQVRTERFALTDPLTRLFNRGVGISVLVQELARRKRTQKPLTLLMLDLDQFKDLNDTRGHLVGDLALRATADVIRKEVRRSDTVCRYGGEEFLIVLPETSVEDASITATRIFTAISNEGHRLGLPLTVSVGLSAATSTEDSVEDLLARADRALYASKERGRNRFSIDLA